MRYWIWKQAPPNGRNTGTVNRGWSTTDVVMEAAFRASERSRDGGFELEDLIAHAGDVMERNGLEFHGFTSNTRDYKSDAERVVRGRFGDMHRSKIFRSTRPPVLAQRPRRAS